eukprot:jgi/Tetstr1/457847/TSEL_044392.t1
MGRDATIVDALKWAAPRIWEVAAASPLGVVPWLEQNRPEVLAELHKGRNLCNGRLAQSKSLAPLGVADDRYRTRDDAGPEWQILSYHVVPGMSAFLPKVDHEDEARRREHETARNMAATKEMRHWKPEAHIGDDEYILADHRWQD